MKVYIVQYWDEVEDGSSERRIDSVWLSKNKAEKQANRLYSGFWEEYKVE